MSKSSIEPKEDIMTREEIKHALLLLMRSDKRVDQLEFKDGEIFQTDCIIFPVGEEIDDDLEGEMEAFDDEHMDGYKFTIDDIVELKIF